MSEEKETNKHLKLLIIQTFAIVTMFILIAFMARNCDKPKDEPITPESILQIQKTKDQAKVKKFEIKVKQDEVKIIDLKQQVKDNRNNTDHIWQLIDPVILKRDTFCENILIKLKRQTMRGDSLQDALTNALDTTIKDQAWIIASYKDLLSMDSLTHLFDQQQLKEAHKISNKGKVKAFFIGLGIGAASVEAVNIINKLKP